VTRIDLSTVGVTQPSGLAFHPAENALYVLDGTGQRVVVLSKTGKLLKELDLSKFDLMAPQGLVIAPSADPTDDPSRLDLYLVDASTLAEFSLTRTEVTVTAPIVHALLVRAINTWAFDPPSPDPAGIAYISASNSLIISDCEVDEMPIFREKNVFETTLSGSLLRSWSTISFSNEPAGIAYNPENKHLFYSSDHGPRVYEVAPGSDGMSGTPDDVMTWFRSDDFGSMDPEGITYDTELGCLDIADGVGEEVYQVCPGPNGIFDGMPLRGGDDVATHFDTSVLGARDP
jgi:DNA-binding beta-propeller fold protein YncE